MERGTTTPTRMLGRALARRCPHCGARGVFGTYWRQRASCSRCELRLDRGETDFFVGAYTINLIAAELLVVGAGLVLILATWPDVPWNAAMFGLAAGMVVAPVVTYPWSRQLWLAFDLIFQPAEDKDFVGSGWTPMS